MIIDVKYYIITITAIFISLGIGIFIGFNMDGEDIYLKQQQQIVDSLEDRFSEFRIEKESLQKRIQDLIVQKEKRDNFMERIYYEVIGNKLTGLNIAIIQMTDHYYYNDVRTTLEEAGAFVPIKVIYNQQLIQLTDEALENINYSFGLSLNKEEILELINNNIIQLVTDNKMSNLLDFLITEGFLQINKYDEDISPIHQVIIAAGNQISNDRRKNIIDLNLIEDLKYNDIRVIGVERLDILNSSIPLYKKANISTIDNVDTLMGRISLVLVCSGKEGSFGEKDTSEALAPVGSF
ncbi:copper transporter [Natronincola ferrireducens]|uniref:Copper transport outer membrane protein, MctB n=1 Tax=Natronincola ferrireducens TaxID=393762 RepID=A0A1G9CFL1_9FIRM|nr:copper transporter [Natronincola ferrireducens]SDK50437.1 Copper transport outer membrane protein, MctB [Natronincola ferrireducens]